jgi:hypothetical protein
MTSVSEVFANTNNLHTNNEKTKIQKWPKGVKKIYLVEFT